MIDRLQMWPSDIGTHQYPSQYQIIWDVNDPYCFGCDMISKRVRRLGWLISTISLGHFLDHTTSHATENGFVLLNLICKRLYLIIFHIHCTYIHTWDTKISIINVRTKLFQWNWKYGDIQEILYGRRNCYSQYFDEESYVDSSNHPNQLPHMPSILQKNQCLK